LLDVHPASPDTCLMLCCKAIELLQNDPLAALCSDQML
jgi:hypothetical protein